MNLRNRSHKKELLDQEDIPFAEIRTNLRELNVINTYLGGHRITLEGVQQLAKGKRPLHICEIGCGGGDNLVAIRKWCTRKQIPVYFTGIDIKEACISFARSKNELSGCTDWVINDYKNVTLSPKPDIIFSSLFCHHFSGEELVNQLAWMHDQSSSGFFINDLHRQAIAYYSIRLLSRLFSKSRLLKNDAPLSVAKGFRKKEWQMLLASAGLKGYRIHWKWAFRHLIIFQHDGKQTL